MEKFLKGRNWVELSFPFLDVLKEEFVVFEDPDLSVFPPLFLLFPNERLELAEGIKME